MGSRIGFISTRFSGIDGVSLESEKWAEVLRRNGNACFWFGGELDTGGEGGMEVPLAHFQHPDILALHRQLFGVSERSPELTETVHHIRRRLKVELQAFIDRFSLQILVVENALTIPLNIPLGLALTETIAERALPVVAHHHDFFWERDRFAVNAVGDFLRMAFPPALPMIRHVVINSEAQAQLAHRCGIASTVIPNIMDFDARVPAPPDTLRKQLGFAAGDIVIFQPTRIIQRKGIEYAVDLIRDLEDPRCKLLITHEAGDEGFDYRDHIVRYARKNRVDMCLKPIEFSARNGGRSLFERHSALWDCYQMADFVTFPSLVEGFGNAFLEAVFFGKPLLVNRYATFIRDIEPLGFDLVLIDGFVGDNTVQEVRNILDSPLRRRQIAETNFSVARDHFSYAVFEDLLRPLLRQKRSRPMENQPDSPKVIPLNPGQGEVPEVENPCGPACRRAMHP